MPRCAPVSALKLLSLLSALVVGWQLSVWRTPADDGGGGGDGPPHFPYVLEAPHVCRGDVFLLVYVHSAPDNHRRRAAIRATWGRRTGAGAATRLVFLLGAASTADRQEALLLESDLHGDLVQVDFVDAYRNLTHKAVLGLRWTAQHCAHAQYVLKTDDDVYVNIFGLLRKLRGMDPRAAHRRFFCLLWTRMAVIRNPRSKWYVSVQQFRANTFPPYCSGLAFVYAPGALAADLLRLSLRTPFFWIDDFYVTGLLARSAGVKHVKWNALYEVGASRFTSTFMKEAERSKRLFGHVHSLDELWAIWRLTSQNLTDNDN